MGARNAETNLHTYDGADVAAHYAALNYLTACERVLFESYIPAGSAILDLGVGGGRTTRYLANRASRYIGVDYAAAMIKVCQTKFPELEFLVADAGNLAAISDASVDVAVFAFNGIDYVLPEKSRQSCFAHIHRVLKTGGRLIFSSHNARAILMIPRWNQERLQKIARRFSIGSQVLPVADPGGPHVHARGHGRSSRDWSNIDKYLEENSVAHVLARRRGIGRFCAWWATDALLDPSSRGPRTLCVAFPARASSWR